MSFGGYFGHILSLETKKSTYLLNNLVGIIYAPWVYTKWRQSGPTFICGHDSERFSQTAIPLWENPLTPNMTERARE